MHVRRNRRKVVERADTDETESRDSGKAWYDRIVELDPGDASREDPDVAAALKDLFVDEGIEVVLDATTRRVEATSRA
jgi:hypothetical protein